MPDICVVHLIRAKNGIEPFANFLKSYGENLGGIDHDLLFAFKGFRGAGQLAEYDHLLKEIPHKKFFLKDFGFDIRAYFSAARAYHYNFFCFLNSFSALLDREWLLKLHTHIAKKNVGLVGATGSYESPYSDILMEQDLVKVAKWQLVRRFGRLLARISYQRHYDPYPNYHIRTNGFMISRELLCSIHSKIIISKNDAHRFESGSHSLTKQVLQQNLKVLVVGKDGLGYEKEAWNKSHTFRQGDQRNLLIADNQTNAYLRADAELRCKLARLTWGAEGLLLQKESKEWPQSKQI